MNRDIKFRYVWRRREDDHVYMTIVSLAGVEEQQGELRAMLDNELWELASRDQFTGLVDKNGVEIYEGDIVHLQSTYETDDPVDLNTEVMFREGLFVLGFHEMQIRGFTREGNWDGEVIGNIHENAELMR